MDDELAAPGWHLDRDTRNRLRIESIRAAVSLADWPNVVIEAEELLDEEPQHREALEHLASALLEIGDCENASDAFEDRLALGRAEPTVLSGLAIARFECCDPVGAVEASREAIRLDSALAEAHYTLGLSLERLPDGAAEAASAFAAARMLSPESYPWPMELTDLDVVTLFTTALTQLPPVFVAFWEPVPVRVEEEPSLTELRTHAPPLPPTVAGLYEGTPPPDARVLEARPSALRLFRKNLARCRDVDEVADQIAIVLEQEALDWLGGNPHELLVESP